MFLIHRLSEAWGISPCDVYRKLTAVGIMDDYIIPFYDVLHTLGAEYLVSDITELARKRGAVV